MTKSISGIRSLMVAVLMMMLSSTAAHASSTDDENALRAQADAYASAFAKGDATTIANMWTAEGTFVDSEGREFKTREKIGKLFDAYFKDYSGQTLKFSIDSIRFPADNVAVEEGTSTLFQKDQPISKARYMVVHVKKDGVWQMLSVSETNAASAPRSLQDLDWLIGDWTAKGTKSLPLQNSWSANHHLIKLESKDNSGEFQLIGWNPATKQIVSWHFDAEGGFGWGKWYQLGDTWIENASAIRADGKTAHATYLLHKLSNDKFTWHSTDRSLNGASVPDLAAVEVSRDK